MPSVTHSFDLQRFTGADNKFVSATVYFYKTDTTILANIYQDKLLTIPSANPVIVAAGALVPIIYLDSTVSYRRRIILSDGTTFDTDPLNTGSLTKRESATRSELALLSPPAIGDTANLTEAGKEGTFIAVNYSAVSQFVAADTVQGIYVRSLTDSTKVWKRVYSGSISVAWFGAIADAVVSTTGVVLSGSNCSTAYLAAQAVGIASGLPFSIIFPPGYYYTTVSLPCSSNQTVFVDNATIYGDFTTPGAGTKGHQKLAVFSICGTEENSPGAGTGDYYETSPRAFAANTTANPSDTSIVALNAPTVSAGDYIQLAMGWAGWHGLVSEIIQVASVVGNTINFRTPLRYGYDNTSTGLGQFCHTYKRAKNAPGSVNSVSWPVAGYRKINPVINAKLIGIGNASLINIRDHSANGYADFAFLSWCSVGLEVSGLRLSGGGVWLLDCQDFNLNHLETTAKYASSSISAQSWLMNGSNTGRINHPKLTNANLDIEEYCGDIEIVSPNISNGLLYIHAGTRNISVTGKGTVSGASAAIQLASGDYEFGNQNLRISGIIANAQGSALVSYTQRLLTLHPHINPAMIDNVKSYFDSRQTLIADSKFISSAGPGAEIYQFQPICVRDVDLGRTINAGIVGATGSSNLYGIARKAVDQTRIGQLTSTGLPTVPGYLGDECWKIDGTKQYVVTNFKRNTVNTHISSTVTTTGPFGTDGYAVGDVIRMLISSGTFVTAQPYQSTGGSPVLTNLTSTSGMTAGMAVTGENIPVGATVLSVDSSTQITITGGTAFYTLPLSAGAQITIGNIQKDHVAVISAVDSPASQITFASTPIPAGYTAFTGPGNYIESTRWA